MQKTVETKKEILIEADERMIGAVASTLKAIFKTLTEAGVVRAYKIVDLAPVDGVTIAQEGNLTE